jgi:Type II restriction endonuclease, TdeIII
MLYEGDCTGMNRPKMKSAIQTVIQLLMERVMTRVLVEDPFIPEKHRAKKPLYAALVPDEIFKGSHFERRFVTPFGHVWEKLALVAAEHGLGYGVEEYMITGTIKDGRLRRISEILNQLEHKAKAGERRKPDWDAELAYILAGTGEEIPVNVICDIYVENRQTGERLAFELKAPLPNSDQTKVSKEKLLKLYAMTSPQVDNAYFALPYNPYGEKENYSWSFPNRWFNMKKDASVLIGNEFWEKIGGVGTYQAFIDAVNEISTEYKERIYREFLGIEPPKNFKKGL